MLDRIWKEALKEERKNYKGIVRIENARKNEKVRNGYIQLLVTKINYR